MTRKAFPYTPFDKQIELDDLDRPRLPMDVPYLIFRNHYGTPSETRRGESENTKGDRQFIVKVQTPHDTTAGGPFNMPPYQGTSRQDVLHDESISSNTVTGGVVKGYITDKDTIRKPFLVSRNLFSPTAHPNDAARTAFTAKIPPPAIPPSKDRGMPPKETARRGAANFTIPAPMVTPHWPTSTEWLRSRFG